MKKLFSTILIAATISCYAQDYNAVSAYTGVNKEAHVFAGASFSIMEDVYDAYTGYIASLYIYEDNITALIGWRLQGRYTFQPYAGFMVGINTSKGDWVTGDIYCGFTFDWKVAPFVEISYPASFLKAGIIVKLNY